MNRETALFRAHIKEQTQSFFKKNNFLEVDPPILSCSFIPEQNIDIFQTEFINEFRGSKKMNLLPSPEYWMKILLAKGYGDIFTISRSFRNNESISDVHNPEFTMLEWYAIDKNYIDSIEKTEEYISFLSAKAPNPVSVPFRRMTMFQAWDEILKTDLNSLSDINEMKEFAFKNNIFITDTDNWESLFHKLFISSIEPELPTDKPLVLMDYPENLPCTALKRDSVYERWELYIKGIEICNCYTENSNLKNFARYLDTEHQILEKQGIQGSAGAAYAEQKLENFPTCTGNALGLDRLIMILGGYTSIEGVIFFPFSDIL